MKIWSKLGVGLLVAISSKIHAQTLNVFAAASLKEAAGKIARQFEVEHRGFHVVLNFAGSQQLAAQIRNGAEADVLLSAGFEPLKNLEYRQKSLTIFATNRLAMVIPISASGSHSFSDISSLRRIVIADRRVPAGSYTLKMLDKAERLYGLAWRRTFEQKVVSREQDVRSVLAKVMLGEADAGFVYETDWVASKRKVRLLEIPTTLNVLAEYPAVAITANGELFTHMLREPRAQKILTSYGFGSPNKTAISRNH